MIGEVVSVSVHGARIQSDGNPPMFVHRSAFGDHAPGVGDLVEYRPFRTQDGTTIATCARPVTAEQVEVARCLG
jgi:hypothetical protein